MRRAIPALVLVVLVGAGILAGVPLPGALRRYPVLELRRVAEKVNAQSGQPVIGVCEGRLSPAVARIDLVRGRLVLDHGDIVREPLSLDEQALFIGRPPLALRWCD
jgi:hypothetical protein